MNPRRPGFRAEFAMVHLRVYSRVHSRVHSRVKARLSERQKKLALHFHNYNDILCWPLLWDVIRVHPCNKDYHEHSLHPDTLAEPTAHHRSKTALRTPLYRSQCTSTCIECKEIELYMHFIKLIKWTLLNWWDQTLNIVYTSSSKACSVMQWRAGRVWIERPLWKSICEMVLARVGTMHHVKLQFNGKQKEEDAEVKNK